jgi:hypothetical protein
MQANAHLQAADVVHAWAAQVSCFADGFLVTSGTFPTLLGTDFLFSCPGSLGLENSHNDCIAPYSVFVHPSWLVNGPILSQHPLLDPTT